MINRCIALQYISCVPASLPAGRPYSPSGVKGPLRRSRAEEQIFRPFATMRRPDITFIEDKVSN
jgi:hypothetical protein